MRLNSIEQAILLTLAYSDIFNFPLTQDEMWKYLISSIKIPREKFEEEVDSLIKSSKISTRGGFYCLAGREKVINNREKNLTEVKQKIAIAKKAAHYLSFIPTVKFIGISGGLAIENVKKDDDIDFFIITKKNTLFTTRFFIVLFLESLNLRRRRNDKNHANKICLNLLIDENNLVWPVKRRDLYTAHEIIQVKPLLQKGNAYIKFIKANNWTKKYFINSASHFRNSDLDKNNKNLEIGSHLSLIENLMKKLQEDYMKKHKTTETVSKGFAAFHPKDYRTKTLRILRTKLQNLGLLTNF